MLITPDYDIPINRKATKTVEKSASTLSRHVRLLADRVFFLTAFYQTFAPIFP